MAVDKLLRAEEEGADKAKMTSIALRFRAHQMAKKTDCGEMELLDSFETCDRVSRPPWKRFGKERME